MTRLISPRRAQARLVGAHLAGPLLAPDAAAGAKTAVFVLGRHLHAVPIGPATADPHRHVARVFPVGDVGSRSLGYVDAAVRAHVDYEQLRDAGAIPADVRLQLNLPTPYTAVVRSFPAAAQARLLPIYADAFAYDVAQIARQLPVEHVLLQWDATAEIAALTGRLPAAREMVDTEAVFDALSATFMRTPPDLDAGLHICLAHARPSLAADMALAGHLAREAAPWAEYVHVGTDRNTPRHPEVFASLRDVEVQRLVLGLVDPDGDQAVTEELIQAAIVGVGRPFALALQCHLAAPAGRLAGPTSEDLLRLHAQYASPRR